MIWPLLKLNRNLSPITWFQSLSLEKTMGCSVQFEDLQLAEIVDASALKCSSCLLSSANDIYVLVFWCMQHFLSFSDMCSGNFTTTERYIPYQYGWWSERYISSLISSMKQLFYNSRYCVNFIGAGTCLWKVEIFTFLLDVQDVCMLQH
jgi:hypothetical protein